MSRRYKWIDTMSKKGQLILIVIIGLLMGTVFVFGFSYWNSDVDKTECFKSYYKYEYHRIVYKKAKVKEIIIFVSDGDEAFRIDGTSINDVLVSEIENLDENSKLFISSHPNSYTILELIIDDKVLLDFDTTMTKIVNERNGFIVLGCVLYLFAFISVIELIKMRTKK